MRGPDYFGADKGRRASVIAIECIEVKFTYVRVVCEETSSRDL